uniref:Dehydrogenase/reductase 11 n=1 Tax=Neolamprologus brichardi TaxID=32507 RepID=A0A3Q4I5I8_NEOBR
MCAAIKEQHKGVDVCINNAGLGHPEPLLCGHHVFDFADLHFYTATKYAVTALTEGLRQELRAEKSHIRATSISPGLVATEFVSRAHNSDDVAGIYASFKALQAEDLASAVTYILSAPPHVQVCDFSLYFQSFLF